MVLVIYSALPTGILRQDEVSKKVYGESKKCMGKEIGKNFRKTSRTDSLVRERKISIERLQTLDQRLLEVF